MLDLTQIQSRIDRYEARTMEASLGVVYHYTSTYGLRDILKDRAFRLTTNLGTKSDAGEKPYFLSLTRSKVGGYHTRAIGGSGVLLELDYDYLKSRYKIGPRDYWGAEFRKADQKMNEMEETLLSDKQTISLPSTMSRLIKSVHILSKNKQDADILRPMVIDLKTSKVPVFIYDNEKDWLAQRPQRAVKPTQVLTVPNRTFTHDSKRRNYVASYLELYHKPVGSKLSKDADKLRYNIKYSWNLKEDISRLESEIHNMKKRPEVGAIVPIIKKLGGIAQFIDFIKTKYKDYRVEASDNKWRKVNDTWWTLQIHSLEDVAAGRAKKEYYVDVKKIGKGKYVEFLVTSRETSQYDYHGSPKESLLSLKEAKLFAEDWAKYFKQEGSSIKRPDSGDSKYNNWRVEASNERYFIRFGDMPKSGRSKLWTAPNLHYTNQVGREYPGISVYEVVKKVNKWYIVTDFINLHGMTSLEELLYRAKNNSTKVYLLKGQTATWNNLSNKEKKEFDELWLGKGSENDDLEGTDGEPLLKNFSIVSELAFKDLSFTNFLEASEITAAETKERITNKTVLYHGTARDFDKFSISSKRNLSTPTDEVNAIFFTDDPVVAYSHARRMAKSTGNKPRVIKATLDFKNLFDATNAIKKIRKNFSTYGEAKRSVYRAVDRTKYDGIAFRGDSVNNPEYVVFNPNIISIVKEKIEGSNKPTVIKNPSWKRLSALIKNAQYGELKGLVSGKDVYWWNKVEDWHHHHQYEALGKGADPTDPFMKNPDFNNQRLNLIRPEKYKDIIALVNNKAGLGVDYITKIPYLVNLIKDGNLYLDIPTNDGGEGDKFIKGIDYLKEHKLESRDMHDNNAWWVKDDGTIVEVGEDNEHGDYSASHFKVPNNNVHDAAAYALKRGWIRVRKTGNHIYVNAMKNCYNLEAIHGCTKLIKQQLASEIQLEIFIGEHDEEDLVSMPFSTAGISKLSHLMRKSVKKELVEASDSYGAWITPDGLALEVSDNHSSIADKYITKNLYEDYAKWVKKAGIADSTAYCLSKGWIRLINEGSRLSVQFLEKNISRKAYAGLMTYLEEHNFDSFFVTTSLPNDREGEYKDFKLQNAEKKFVAYVRSHMIKNVIAIDDNNNKLPDNSTVLETWTSRQGHRLHLVKTTEDDLSDKYHLVQYSPTGQVFTDVPEYAFLETARDGLLKLVREARRKIIYVKSFSMTANAVAPESTYWITTEGNILNLENDSITHAKAFRKYMERHPAVEELFYKEFSSDNQQNIYLFATRDLGWIRVVANILEGYNIMICENKVSSKAVATMARLAKEQDFLKFRIEHSENQNKNHVYSKYSEFLINVRKNVNKQVTAADDDKPKTLKRYETEDGIYAMELATQGKGFDVIEYQYHPMVKRWIKQSASYRPTLEAAQANLERLLDAYKSMKFKEVKLGVNIPKADTKGFKVYDNQPNVPGLELQVQTIGSVRYAKVVHEESGRTAIDTGSPLKISFDEFVQRMNRSTDLASINWTKSLPELNRIYGKVQILNVVQRFKESLDFPISVSVRSGKTQNILDEGLKEWVKDYLIARYLKRPDSVRNIKRNIDQKIKENNLDPDEVYLYYGDPDDRKQMVWEKIGLTKVGSSAPYKYEFANKDQKWSWSTVTGKARKAFFNISLNGKTIAEIGINNESIPKAIVELGNKGSTNQDSPYFKDIVLIKRQTTGFIEYDIVGNGKVIGTAYNPTMDLFNVIYKLSGRDKKAEKIADEVIKTKTASKPTPAPVKTNNPMIGQYVEAVDSKSKPVKGILVKQNTVKGRTSGEIIYIKSGKPVKIAVTEVYRLFEKSTKALRDAASKYIA